MNHRLLVSMSATALAIAFTAVLLTPSIAAGQHVVKAGAAAIKIAADKTAGKYVAKKTPDEFDAFCSSFAKFNSCN